MIHIFEIVVAMLSLIFGFVLGLMISDRGRAFEQSINVHVLLFCASFLLIYNIHDDDI